MGDVLVGELLRQLPEILERIAETHADCVDVQVKLHKCTELTSAIIESEQQKAQVLLTFLRNFDASLTKEERQKFVSAVDYLLRDSSGFIDAMLRC